MATGANQTRCHGSLSITENGVRGLRDLAVDALAILVKAALREYSGRFPNGREMPMPEGVELIITTDLALATYLDLRGCPVVAIRPNTDPRAGRHQAAEFVCADYEGASSRISLAFISSEAAEYNTRMGTLKKEAIRVRDLGRR
jgi:hypothetical protein